MSRAAAPMVAIVGRPNVGKSTLFNRLVGRRQAIVHNVPGVTRDRIFGRFEIEDERPVELIDTGGLTPGDEGIGINRQVLLATEECDLILFVVDGREGLTPADEEVAEVLRRLDRPTIGVVNKADTREAEQGYYEFAALGLEDLVLVSAEHGLGAEELIERLRERLPQRRAPVTDLPSLAIVGRPNVGKSSLLNRLLAEERSIVSPVAGTTRDPIDSILEREDGQDFLLIDTAGIRRRSQVADAPEELAVMMARRQIGQADVVALLVDASAGVTSGDLAVAGAIWEAGKAPVVVVNKWDLLDEESREHLELGMERLDEVLYGPERVNLSALTGRALQKLMPAVDRALAKADREVSTNALNELIQNATQRHHAPSQKGRPWRFLYATQVGRRPPTFLLFCNRVLPRQDPYRRYLENVLRRELDLEGTPVRLVLRERRS